MFTVIGMFDALAAADHAAAHLAQQGLGRDRIVLKPGEALPTADATSHAAPAPRGQADGVLASMGGVFANLVESHAQGAADDVDALLRHGGTALLVDARSEAERDMALRVLRAAGAVDVGVRSQAQGAASGPGTAVGNGMADSARSAPAGGTPVGGMRGTLDSGVADALGDGRIGGSEDTALIGRDSTGAGPGRS